MQEKRPPSFRTAILKRPLLSERQFWWTSNNARSVKGMVSSFEMTIWSTSKNARVPSFRTAISMDFYNARSMKGMVSSFEMMIQWTSKNARGAKETVSSSRMDTGQATIKEANLG
ncbi:hypothetical protein RCL_jg28706.t1 [Rhizophagus clarus]|uniref:Uncharacterized protein n=1 Tax=Rhizophagus clarus TaxID=94130 RepID=A0A8H3LUX9_9GLOM|nr:hypothetical protein RCL_jg28706.t1 [Rhizophagus clarus]